MTYSNLFVVLMGLGTVFFGLVCIVFLIKLMGFFVGKTETAPQAAPAAAPAAAAPLPQAEKVDDRAGESELVAVITAALAHELDTSPSGIRIMSVKKH